MSVKEEILALIEDKGDNYYECNDFKMTELLLIRGLVLPLIVGEFILHDDNDWGYIEVKKATIVE